MGNANPGRRSAILAITCLAGVAAILIALHVLPSDETQIRRAIPGAAAIPRSDWRRFIAASTAMMSAGSVSRFESFERNLTALCLAGPPLAYEDRVLREDFMPIGQPNPSDVMEVLDNLSPVTVVAEEDITRFTCDITGDTASGVVKFESAGLWRGRVEYRAEKRIGVWTITEFRLPASRMGVRLGAKGRWRFFSEGDPK